MVYTQNVMELPDCLPLPAKWLPAPLMRMHSPPAYAHDCFPLSYPIIHIYYSFDTGEYHESVGLVFTRVPQARA